MINLIFLQILLFGYTNANNFINRDIFVADSLLNIELNKDAADKYNDVGFYYYKQQNYSEALNYWKKSLENYSKINDLYGISNLSNRVGVIYKKIGHYSEALKYYNQSYEISMDNLSDESYAIVAGKSLNNLGTVNMNIGDYNRSLKFFNKSLKIKEELNNQKGQVATILNMGNVYTYLRDDYNALEFINKGHLLAEKINAKDYIAKAKTYKASLYSSTMQWDSAMVYHKESIDYYRKIKDYRSLCTSLQDIGRIFLEIKDYNNAYKFFEEALDLTKNRFNDNYQIIFSYLGLYYDMIDDDSTAIEYYKKSIEYIEKYRMYLDNQTQQIFYQDKRIESYRRLIRLLIFNKKYKESFKYLEKMKARALLDMLEGAGGINFSQIVSEDEILKEKLLTKKLEKINRLISDNIYDEYKNLDSLVFIKNEIRFQLEEFQLNLYRKYPELREFRGLGEPINDIRRAKRIIARDEAVIYYFVTDSDIFQENRIDIFVLTRDGIVHREVFGSEVEEALLNIDDFLDDLSSSIPKWDNSIAEILYNTLINPIKDDVKGKNRVCIIPDGKLNYIPFQGLKNTLTNQYLIEEFAIYYNPSLSTLKWLRSSGTYGSRELFAIGDPIFDQFENELDMLTMRSNLAPLPASRDEVLALEDIYESRAKVYLSEESTESNFKEYGPDYGILHIASHGLVDDTSPLYSSLAFTNEENEDGFLEVRELFNIELNADITILSACKTGVGKNVNGEGILGLTRGFFTAGVPSVVSSLWNVADVSTRDLMIEFHTYLNDGERPAVALQKAQIHLIKNTQYNNPIFWAPFILTGDSE